MSLLLLPHTPNDPEATIVQPPSLVLPILNPSSEWNHTACFMCLASFTPHIVVEIHPWSCMFCCTYSLLCHIPLCNFTTVCPFSSRWMFGMFPVLSYYEEICYKQYIHTLFEVRFHFFWVGDLLSHRVGVYLTWLETPSFPKSVSIILPPVVCEHTRVVLMTEISLLCSWCGQLLSLMYAWAGESRKERKLGMGDMEL